jgi:hypothetical protein
VLQPGRPRHAARSRREPVSREQTAQRVRGMVMSQFADAVSKFND